MKLIFYICLFLASPLFGYNQSLKKNEEVLRHFKEGAKLVPHIYDQDSNKWGFIFGHCMYFDYEWAEKYEINGGGLVIGAIAHVIGSNANTEKTTNFSVYTVHKDRKPDSYIYTHSVTYDKLNLDGSETQIMFDSSIYVKDSFFVAFGVADYAHDPDVLGKDTIYLLATEEGTRDEEDLKVFGRNCIRTHTPQPELAWIDAYTSEPGRKSVNAYLAIFPIMDFSSSTNHSNISKGSTHFFKNYYNKSVNTFYSEISSKTGGQTTITLTTLDGKEICSTHLNLEPNKKTSITLKTPSSAAKGTYILIASGQTFKLAQKAIIY